MKGKQHSMLKVSYAISRLFCEMLFVLCNVKLGKCRCCGMNRGTKCAPSSVADAPWEPAWVQSIIAGITTSHAYAVVGQPLLQVSCAWRSQACPSPAMSLLWAGLALGKGPFGPQLLQLCSWWVSEHPPSNLGRLFVCGPNPPPVGSYRLMAAGRSAPELPWHSWPILGLKLGWYVTHLCLTGESGMWKVKRGNVALCVLVRFGMKGEAVFTFFKLSLTMHFVVFAAAAVHWCI